MLVRTSCSLSCSSSLYSPSCYTWKVVLVYLIPWHSHNIVDQVIVWCHNAMKGKNFYSPMVIVEAVNEVKGVNMNFIDHHDAQCLCYVGWGPILKKQFKSLLVRYTFKYFFEFNEGHVSMQSLCTTPDNEVVNIPLVNATNISLIRQSLLFDLFNVAVITIEQPTDVMVESMPNAPTPSTVVKARPRYPKKKVVTALGLPQKLILQFFSK